MKKIFPLFLLLFPGWVQAGGFQLSSLSAEPDAMGGCGMALPPGVCQVYYNPGAVSFLSRSHVNIGASLILPNTEFVQDQYIARTVPQVFSPFGCYANYKPKKGIWQAALGIYTPFGSGTEWKDDWMGQYIIRQIELRCVFVQPTLSLQLGKHLGFGLGGIYATGSMLLRRAIPVQDIYATGSARLSGDADGVGFNSGLYFQDGKLQLGLTYRSAVNMMLRKGKAEFQVPASLSDTFPNTTFHTTLPLPASAGVGLAWKFSDRFLLCADFNYVFWSTYDTLRFQYDTHTTSLQDTRLARLYKNSWNAHLGASYTLNDTWKFMAGGSYDASPATAGYISPDLPDANRLGLSAGIGWQRQDVKVIFKVEYFSTLPAKGTTLQDAADNFSGTYQTRGLVPGLGIDYAF